MWIRNDHPALLDGLESWLQLGLLTDREVRELARDFLACDVEEALQQHLTRVQGATSVAPVMVPPPAPVIEPVPEPVGAVVSDFLPPDIPSAPPSQKGREPAIAHLFRAMAAEISVVWLLFLGVFLVVVSSGVLAASQWGNVSAVERYLILLGYTLAFWGVGLWTRQRNELRLTSEMLQLATLLLIPVNFWAIDSFGLAQSFLGRGVGAIAALLLSVLTFRLLRPTAPQSPTLTHLHQLNGIGLNWLHLGWGMGGFPLVATYVGILGTALNLAYQNQSQPRPTPEETTPPKLPLGTLAIALSALLLLGRALLIQQVAIAQLGLALGVCGAALVWFGHDRQGFWNWAGVGLLALGWLVSVEATPPWQAIAVSCLGMGLLLHELQRRPRGRDLTLLFLLGLQTLGLIWFSVPETVQQGILEGATTIAGSSAMPEALLGVALLPYAWLTLGLTSRWQRQQPALAKLAVVLALILGTVLTMVSLGNPLLRSLNLLLSALTLLGLLRQRPQSSRRLISLTHLVIIGAIGSWVNYAFPHLTLSDWALLLLLGMTLEWLVCLSTHAAGWKESTWLLGYGFAVFSYLLLLLTVLLEAIWGSPEVGSLLPLTDLQGHRLLWLLAPGLLTFLGSRPQFRYRFQAASWGIATVLLAQGLTLWWTAPRLVGLGVGTGLMLLNTRWLAGQRGQTVAAVLTVGVGLGWIAALVDWRVPEADRHLWITFCAILAGLLWLIWSWLRQQQAVLAPVYAVAVNSWGTALTGASLTVLSTTTLTTYLLNQPLSRQVLVAAVITAVGLGFRLVQQPAMVARMGMIWCGEVVMAVAIALHHPTPLWLAGLNLTVGSIMLLVTLGWRQLGQAVGWREAAFLYAGLAVGLAHTEFTATTGLFTLAGGVIVLLVGRHQRSPHTLSYLGLTAVSVAAYELLVYQLMQASGGAAGDGITLLAGLSVLLALGYGLFAGGLFNPLRLSLNGLRWFAHIHWGLGTMLAIAAWSDNTSPSGTGLWLVVMALLSGYALAMGHRRLTGEEIWIWAGILAAIACFIRVFQQVLPEGVLSLWGGAIASGFAILMYQLPWESWGWATRPWRLAAVGLPGLVVLVTVLDVSIQSILLTAATYAWLAKATGRLRLNYLCLLGIIWATLRFLSDRGWVSALWVGILVGAVLIFFAQIDPALQSTSARQQRHWLRLLAVGLINLSAFYQAEITPVGLSQFWMNLLILLLALGFGLAGVILRVRAFLYIGTLTFVIQILRQVWLFISAYSLLLGIAGTVLGLLFIWIAATFEARRQLYRLVQQWFTELEGWQ